jgi:hypothetical protein
MAGGFLTDALDAAREPIRGFLQGLPDPLAPQADPFELMQGRGSPYAPLSPQPGYNPLQSNRFLLPLLQQGRGQGLFDGLLRGPGPLPGALARARGQAPSSPSQAPGSPRTLGPLARALQPAQPQGQAAPADGPTHSAQYRSIFQQIGEQEGVPWEYLAALADTERSGATQVSPAGARGIMQVIPGQGYDMPGEDPTDVVTSVRQGARALKAKYAATGSWDAAASAYFGYGTDAGGQTTEGYTNAFQQNLQRIRSGQTAQPQAQQPPQPTSQTAALPTPPPGAKPLKGVTIDQYGSEGLATGAADYICGPIAAKAFLATQGREPTLREALDLARAQGLIDPSSGMHGIEATAQLIRKLGGYATVGTPDAAKMSEEIRAGRPVIVDTNAGSRGHYFVAEDYDPSTGRFDFGASARALRASGGRTWYTLDEIAGLGFGSVHGAIYAH